MVETQKCYSSLRNLRDHPLFDWMQHPSEMTEGTQPNQSFQGPDKNLPPTLNEHHFSPVPPQLQQHNFTIQNSISGISSSTSHIAEALRTLKLTHESRCHGPPRLVDSRKHWWIKLATSAVYDGGGGVLIQYPDESEKTTAIPTGISCSNMLRDDPMVPRLLSTSIIECNVCTPSLCLKGWLHPLLDNKYSTTNRTGRLCYPALGASTRRHTW